MVYIVRLFDLLDIFKRINFSRSMVAPKMQISMSLQ